MKSDREKWDRRYSKEISDSLCPDPLLLEFRGLFSSGRALDLACGLGSTSLFLARCGYWVDAFDTSLVALQNLMKRSTRENLSIGVAVVDLDYYPLPTNTYDVVTVFYFFSQNLLTSIMAALKPGGILVYSTFNYHHVNERPDFCRDYLVPLGGMGHFFPDLEVIADRESSGENPAISQFIGTNSGR